MQPSNPLPPRWADRFFSWFCKDDLEEILRGDLYELFENRVQEKGVKKARIQFVFDVFGLLRPFAIKGISTPTLYTAMFKHHVQISFRNLLRNRTHSLINLAGLTLGIICSTILFLKVRSELQVDIHHTDTDQIYRVMLHNINKGMTNSGVPHPLAPALRESHPDLQAVSIIQGLPNPLVTIEQESGEPIQFQEEYGTALVEPAYFDMFHYEFIEGDPAKVVSRPFTGAICETLAKKYFPDQSPIGKTINLFQQYDVEITGVFKDPPATELPDQMLISYDLGTLNDEMNRDWGNVSSSVQCYVKLSKGMTPESIESGSIEMMNKYRDFAEGEGEELHLMNLRDVHFLAEGDHYSVQPIEKKTLWSFGLIGLFLLVTACINFVNLNSVLIFQRVKEVGVRKVLGGLNRQIITYFLSETGMIVLVALFLSSMLLPWASKEVTEYLGTGWEPQTFSDPGLWMFWTVVVFAIVFLAGGYPAFLLSRVNPVMALKNKVDRSFGRGVSLRKGLVVIQFAISQALIIITFVMMSQMDYFLSKPLGFEKEALMELNIPVQEEEKYALLKSELLMHKDIQNVSISSAGAASGSIWKGNFVYRPQDEKLPVIEEDTQVKLIDEDYVETYQMNMLVGEGVIAADSVTRMVVNETFLKFLEIDDPQEAIGLNLEIWGNKAPITGVIQDFHANSLHRPIDPLIFMYDPENFYVAAVKLNHVHEDVLAHIEKSWNTTFPNQFYKPQFLDERIERFYRNEKKTLQLFELFAGIAIFIGCIGLFGLISFVVIQRTKEIGIRKVLGASVGQIITLINREFAIMVGGGFLIAAPVAAYFMNQWLTTFAYKIDLGIGVFFMALLVSVAIVGITVGIKSYKAAIADPVVSLRDE